MEPPEFEFDFSDSANLLPRSRLLAVSPYGLGTWKVEGLTGYIRRLVDAHAIPFGRFKKLVLGDYLRKRGDSASEIEQTELWWTGIGGVGEMTRAWVQALDPMLQLNRTIETTLLPISARVCARGSYSRTLRHCRICSNEDRSNGHPYRYLIWDIHVVSHCPIHECPLEIEIPTIMYQRARWRSVEEQNQPTRMVYESTLNELYRSSEIQRSKLVARLLESPSFRMGFPENQKSNVAFFLNSAIEKLTDGVASHLAKHLRVGKSSLHGWTTGAHLPPLWRVVDIAQALNCPIEAVLAGDTTALPWILPEYSEQIPRKPRAKHNVKGRKFRLSLTSLIYQKRSQIPPASLSEIAREVGVDRTQIANAYPDLAKQVSSNRKEWLSRKAKLIRSVRHHAYREAAVALAELGQLPTRNRVMSFLSNISVFSSDDREICQAICYEVRLKFQLKGQNPKQLRR